MDKKKKSPFSDAVESLDPSTQSSDEMLAQVMKGFAAEDDMLQPTDERADLLDMIFNKKD
jgi:hypothetical protein